MPQRYNLDKKKLEEKRNKIQLRKRFENEKNLKEIKKICLYNKMHSLMLTEKLDLLPS